MNKNLIFLHIPKAAGTTLKKVMKRQLNPENSFFITPRVVGKSEQNLINLPSEEKLQLQLIFGHVKFGFHKYFEQPFEYATLLRDPVERIISHYYYVKRNKAHPNHDITRELGSIDIYVSSKISSELENDQTRRIAGLDDSEIVTDISFELAKNNLINRFSHVGIVEEFEESLLKMKEQFGLKKTYYITRNSSVRSAPPTPELVDRIKKRNHYDLMLYSIAKQMVAKRPNPKSIDILQQRILNQSYSLYKYLIRK